MKANELMIGDWVFYITPTPSVPVKIGKIYVNKTISEANFYGNLGNDCVLDICFEPIPLTAEILEKNGFEVTHNMSSSGNKDVWSLRVSKNKVFHIIEHHNKRKFPYFLIELGSNSDIKYVHQLQHALRLCKIEKEIEL